MTGDNPYADLRVVFFPFCAVLVGIILDEANKRVKFLGIPDTILQFTFAFCASLIINKCLPLDVAVGIDNNYTWTNLQPQTILTILLPPLIFESSFKINSSMFFAKLRFISTLTVWVYLVTLALSVLLCLPLLYLVVGSSYSAIALFVAIIVATDPVAVVAMLEEYGAPHKLRILIEGESLLNDGLALTAYRVLVDFLKLELGIGDGFDYLRQSVGLVVCLVVSPIFGCIFAWIVSWTVSKIHDIKKQQPLIIVSVYAVFIICDLFGGSSALGLVFFGVTLHHYREKMSPETTEAALGLWATLGYWANNVIFIFSGYTVGRHIFQEPTGHYLPPGQLYLDWSRGSMLNIMLGVFLCPVMLVARIYSVYTFYKMAGYAKAKLPTMSDMVILTYSGLRGALGLILALELAKMSELVDFSDTKMILHMTCSSTLTCLLVQGMTFSSIMNKEGATRRSKYAKDSAETFAKSMVDRGREIIEQMRGTNGKFLRCANWEKVQDEVIDELISIHKETVKEQQEQGAVRRNINDRHDGEIIDVRTNFYGVLLAKTREAWKKGALSGNSAHVIISLLEHGIDEGSITAKDVEDHLEHVDPSRPFLCLCRIVNALYTFTSVFCPFVASYADFGGEPMFSFLASDDAHEKKAPEGDRKPFQRKAKRKFEKWLILHSILLICYTAALAWATFDRNAKMVSERKSIMMCSGIFLFMSLLENIVLYRKQCKAANQDTRSQNRNQPAESKGGLCSIILRSTKEFVLLSGATCILILSTFASYWLLMVEKCRINQNACPLLNYVPFGLTTLCCIFRLSRALPWLVVVLHEHCEYKKMSCNRIHLAVLDYLHHLAKETRITVQLFPKDSLKPARKELHRFKIFLEGLMRLQFKDHDNETDIQRVNKTRQAIRMASSEIKTIISNFISDGFVPESAVETWQEVVMHIREKGDSIIGVPPLHTRKWLETVPWIRSLRHRAAPVLDFLVEAIRRAPAQRFEPGVNLNTNGTSIFFLQRGICKVYQWRSMTSGASKPMSHHDSYVMQGEFLGSRNILLHDRKNKMLPFALPKRRYQTSTACDIVQLDSNVIEELLQKHSMVYREVDNWLQMTFLYEEWKRNGGNDGASEDDFRTVFEIHGRKISKAEKIVIPDNKIALIGCFTEVRQSTRAAETDTCKFYGPATIRIEPADRRAQAMIFMMGAAVVNENKGGSVKEKSNISFIHDVTSRRLIATTEGIASNE